MASSVMHEQMRKLEDKYSAIEDLETVTTEMGITGINIQDMAATGSTTTTSIGTACSHSRATPGRASTAHTSGSRPSKHKNPQLLVEPSVREIAFLLGSYPDVMKMALKTHEPGGIIVFAFHLRRAILSAWETNEADGDNLKARARMALYLAARDVLGASLRLLSITPLERM